jgi:hypothetical protein
MVGIMNLSIPVSVFSRIGSVLCFAISAFVALAPSARAQQPPTEVYGPWNVIVLPDGPGLSEPMPGAFGGRPSTGPIPAELLAAHTQWTISFWFRSADPLGNDVGAILECPHHGQLQLVTRRLIDELRQPFHTIGRVRIVLHKSLVVDVLRRNVYIPGADAVKYRQDFLDVSFRHWLISFDRAGRPSLCRTRKAFDPFLVIAVERTGILPPEFLKKERALLRLLG